MFAEIRNFFKYVIPSVFSFALSGVYAIVDGYFVGNSLGDVGLSSINMAYPVVALIQALGTGLGMGGAIHYSISRAEKKQAQAKEFIAGALWTLLIVSVLLTFGVFCLNRELLIWLGAEASLLELGQEYIAIIALGAALQVIGTGLIPFIRNFGGSLYAMIAMVAGFIANIILDYQFVWVQEQGVAGAAWATVIGQGITMLLALVYMLYQKQFTLRISPAKLGATAAAIIQTGVAPFGLAMTPNISLIIINRFSMAYDGEPAIAVYACIAYIICIIYLILQGVGDGCQPLISQYYGEKNFVRLYFVRKLAYGFAIFLSLIGCVIMYITSDYIGAIFGASAQVNAEIARIMPIFLVSVPFVAVLRITTSCFYATEKSAFSYILTFIEPLFMLVLMFILPPLFGGQLMIWWSTVLARILAAILALILKRHVDRQDGLRPRILLPHPYWTI